MNAPFPYFGGKSTVAKQVWHRFGSVVNYVEPFFGSGAVLLNRPAGFTGTETVNDYDGLISNFWRAIKHDPEETAHHADWPVSEIDMHARHLWLLGQRNSLTDRLGGNPDYYDPKAAGWWVWGACAWIGSGWCSGDGPWQSVDGILVKGDDRTGISKRMPHLNDYGMGINRQIPCLRNYGTAIHGKCSGSRYQFILSWFNQLSERLRDVRVCNGDWSRVMGYTVLDNNGQTAVFLDPPYSCDKRHSSLYACDSMTIAQSVREWCIKNGDNTKLRIALCGYEGEHAMPDTWTETGWQANGGYANQGHNQGRVNAKRERIWFSPHCINDQYLFDL